VRGVESVEHGQRAGDRGVVGAGFVHGISSKWTSGGLTSAWHAMPASATIFSPVDL
jgi:hypothetical protein